jgi:hypothetical protein
VNVDRELQTALDVEPSPEFLARVRMRIAEEPAPRRVRFGWFVLAEAAFATAVLAAIILRPTTVPPAGEPLLVAKTLPSVAVAADLGRPGRSKLRPYGDPTDVGRPFRAADPVGRPFRAAMAGASTDAPEILVDPRETAMLRRVILGAGRDRIDLKAVIQPSPFVVADLASQSEIEIVPIPEIVPISIEPLQASSEGARQ